MSAGHNEPVLIRKLPFVFLEQHSLSFSQRYDLQQQPHLSDARKLWLAYAAKAALIHSEPSISEPDVQSETSMSTPFVVFVAMIPLSKNSTAQYFQSIYDTKRIKIVQIDPIDWNGETDESPNLERLDTIISALHRIFKSSDRVAGGPCVLIFDSISPILMRHGFNKTLLFLQELAQSLALFENCRMAIVPIQSEMLTAHQRHALDNALLATAILNVTQSTSVYSRHAVSNTAPESDAVLLRRNVRKSGGIHREIIPDRSRAVSDRVDVPVGSDKKVTKDDYSTTNAPFAEIQERGIRGKSNINLQHHEGSRTTTSTDHIQTQRQPNIFIQDDDPEYEDYDEDEPDDDLDL